MSPYNDLVIISESASFDARALTLSRLLRLARLLHPVRARESRSTELLSTLHVCVCACNATEMTTTTGPRAPV